MSDFGSDDLGTGGDPVSEGEQYEVTIEDTGRKGDGIAKIDGLVVFVPDTSVGDTVSVKINKVGRSAAFAEKVE